MMQNEIAKGLLSIGAVFFRPNQPFTWASGIKSPVYCDNRLILTAPPGAKSCRIGPGRDHQKEYPSARSSWAPPPRASPTPPSPATFWAFPLGYVPLWGQRPRPGQPD